MRRALAVTFVLAAAAAWALTSSGSGKETGSRYTIEFDNAFGLVQGGDVKVAGVRAGKISGPARRPSHQARAGRHPDHAAGLRLAALGRLLRVAPAVADRRVLRRLPPRLLAARTGGGGDDPRGAHGVDHPDRPHQQHPAAALPRAAADHPQRARRRRRRPRAEDLNATIRRASPALRETDRVLGILARQNQVAARPHAERRHRGRRPGGQPQERRALGQGDRGRRDRLGAAP